MIQRWQFTPTQLGHVNESNATTTTIGTKITVGQATAICVWATWTSAAIITVRLRGFMSDDTQLSGADVAAASSTSLGPFIFGLNCVPVAAASGFTMVLPQVIRFDITSNANITAFNLFAWAQASGAY